MISVCEPAWVFMMQLLTLMLNSLVPHTHLGCHSHWQHQVCGGCVWISPNLLHLILTTVCVWSLLSTHLVHPAAETCVNAR